MKLGTRDPNVVLIYENAEDISGASQIIASLGKEYRAVALDKTTSDFIRRTKPAVILFALSSVDKVIDYYAELIEQKQLNHPHYTILLCSNHDANVAFQCCIKGVFNDYFVYQPLYEKLRLIMMVQHGLLFCGVKNVTTEFSTDVVEPIDSSMEDLIAIVQGHKQQVDGHTLVQNPASGALSQLPSLDQARQYSDQPVDDEVICLLSQLEPAVKSSVLHLVQTMYQQSATLADSAVNEHGDQHNLSEQVAPSAMEEATGSEMLPEFTDFAGGDALDLPISTQAADAEVKDGQKVLVVEDNPIYRDMLVGVLRRANYEVDEARDGLVALRKVADNEYDLILMDLFMPKLDGLNTTKQLRGISKRKDTPIVALTGNTNKELIRKWASYGLKGYLIKPSNNNEILSCVSKIVKQKDPSPA